jgi:GNAT superfamily N-acetyltransferase
MSNLVVKPVETRRERRQFLQLPWQLHRDDPNWMPPLRTNQKELVGYRKHPFHEGNKVQTYLTVFDRSFEGTWRYVPLTDNEIDHMAAGLKHLIAPEMTRIAEIDGKAVGVVLGLLDYNPRIKKIDGRLYPLGFLRLLWNRRAIERVRFMAANVVPEYQLWGLGLVLLDRLIADAEEWGIQEAEFSWVMESNRLSLASLERGGAKRQKTYRVYDYEPAEVAEEANR